MAKKNKFKVTIEESFAYGRLEGIKETLSETLYFINNGMDEKILKVYLEARIKGILDIKNLSVRGQNE